MLKNKALWYFKILIIAVCASTISRSYGAQPIITKSSISSLLQQPTVSAIYRDRAGILWIGTQQGLHRFDGASVIVFNSDKSNHYWIPESEIRDITEDIDGNVLVATAGGELLKWNQQSEAFESLAHSGDIGKARLVRVLVSKRGIIWLLSKDGLILYDPKLGHTAEWIENLRLVDTIGVLHAISEDSYGNLWVGGDLGLVKVLLQEKSLVSLDFKTLGLPENSSITALDINNQGNLIIGTNTGHLVAWDIEAGAILAKSTIDGGTQIYISRFLLYEEKLIIGTDKGLFMSDSTLSFFKNLGNKSDEDSNLDVYSLYPDGPIIWVGKIDGLDILSFTQFELFNSKNSGVSNHVLAFEQDSIGRMWIGTYAGLYLYNNETQSHVMLDLNSDSSTPDDQRIATIVAKNNYLWLGLFQGGIHIVDSTSGRSETLKLGNFNEMAVTKILSDDKTKDVWIATYNQGLFRYTSKATRSYYENKSLPEKSITFLFRSKNDAFLVVSENRVYMHNPLTDQFREIHFDFGLGGQRPYIYSIAQGNNDDILVGTKDHGVFTWTRANQLKNAFKLLQLTGGTGGLANSTIYGIEPDANGNLWCSTQNGIVKLDPKGKLIKRFTTADGLQGNDFALGASFTSREGLIYFGGANGYNRFDPNEVSIDSSPSPMRLSSISLPKEDERNIGDVNRLKSLELTHRDHFVTFQFSVLDFIFPERNQYRYKLENFDPEWIENGTRNTATYTNLPAGEYVLRVQGANSAGIWNLEGITLPVRVLPPPWLTWWAYTIYGTALLLLGWSAHRIYHSYAVDRKSAQLAAEMFEAANQADDDMQEQLELQDELIRSSFEHTQATLGIVSDYISLRSGSQPDNQIRDLTDCSVKRIAALSMLEECLYYQAGESVVDLHKYTEGLIPILLQNSSVRPETIITINEVTSELLPAQLATPLSMVFYELMENCVQHAFDLNSPANYIRLRLTHNSMNGPSEGSFELSVSDNGVGLPDSIENLALESSGISVVLSIAQKLGATLQCSDSSGGATISLAFHYTDASNYPDNQENPA